MTSFDSFSRFRHDMVREVLRQQQVNVKPDHWRRDTLKPGTREAAIVLLNTGCLPVFTVANILELVFFKSLEQSMLTLWDLQAAGVRSSVVVYRCKQEVAWNKLKQAEFVLTMAGHSLPRFQRPVFLLEEIES